MAVTREQIEKFIAEAQADDDDQDFPYLWFHEGPDGFRMDELGIDGEVSLEQLKRIVAAWERLNNAAAGSNPKPPRGTPNSA